jgi:hypothetical protein
MSAVTWRRSSRTNNGSGNCVELALLPHHTAVRDSKNPTGGTLVLTPAAWHALVAATKSGHLDNRGRERKRPF